MGNCNPETAVSFINRTFYCNSPRYDITAELYNITVAGRNDDTKIKCRDHGMCMWWMSARFCAPPFCWKNTYVSRIRKQCRTVKCIFMASREKIMKTYREISGQKIIYLFKKPFPHTSS